MKNHQKQVIYVGKAKNLKKRLKQYFLQKQDDRPQIPLLLQEISFVETILVPNESDAFILENRLIKEHKPKYNVLLKDDKNFIGIFLDTQEPWPRLRLLRKKESDRQKNIKFFGPYPSAYAARGVVALLAKLFPLRQCSNDELKRRTRPCILYAMGRCLAPCMNLCSAEEYQKIVEKTLNFLQGKQESVIEALYQEIEEASSHLEFEKAAHLLQTIEQIRHITEKKSLLSDRVQENSDALGFVRHRDRITLFRLVFREGLLVRGEPHSFNQLIANDEEILSSLLLQLYLSPQESPPKEILLPFQLAEKKELESVLRISLITPEKGVKKEALALAQKNAEAEALKEISLTDQIEETLLNLQETLQLQSFPNRIECFDISHLAGSDTVSSVTAFTQGKFDPKRSRLLIIKTATHSDDLGAMKETLVRRLTRLKEENDLPDLLLIDGGEEQWKIAKQVIEELDIATLDLLSIAKEKGKHTKSLNHETVFSKAGRAQLPPHSPLLLFLQRIRDKAHSRALAFHQKRRTKRVLHSTLSSVKGIGPKKEKRLLQAFGSFKAILAATDEELLAVPGMRKQDLEQIRVFNNPKQQLLKDP